ncbi:TetR/AcrR family transcriptional regulator [Lentzea flaviverrucosa]|uniref:Transcriptional regulator, TetR family n=1 Tax=Lentzea flaviverrucosa TaxID=200379 RepID=A0A1H9VGN0_9PSEU|nr:TetR family transcriptional regulator [Lentzea flaviverrucosa]RDI23853.1 TetR family transcriptional regulator [Lentzea flaviverrucosa]SES20936.1 transcriptional regulator, TetR family [Lentzea flaviverrucosa]
MKPVRGRGAAHDERRGAILEAVFEIIDTEGTHQVSIRRVAERAGVSVGRVQHYFPSKDDLLTAAFTAINDLGTARVQARLAESSPAEALLTELIPGTEEERRQFRVAQAFETHALTNPELVAQLRQGYDELVGLLTVLTGPAAKELLALALGLAHLTQTGNLTPEEARAIVRSGIEKHG